MRCAGWEEGMAASLRWGVAALGAGRCDWVVVTLGDQPRITAPVVAAVADVAVSSPPGTAAVRAAYAGVPGHPVALGRELLSRVAALRGDVGARDLLSGAEVRTVEAAQLCDPADVDTPRGAGGPATMKLEQSFTVEAPVDRVWDALVDVQRVAPCLPGAQVTSVEDDGTYHGTFTVKLGPTTAAYNGTLKIEELNEAAHAAVTSVRGTDKRGQGGASATIRSTVGAHEGGTKVDVVTDFTFTGRLARFGRGGMIEDVSRRLMRDFAACLQATITAAPAAAAAASSEAVIRAEPAGEPPTGEPPTPEPAGEPPTPEPAGEPATPAEPAAAGQRPHPHVPHPHMPAKPLNALALLLGVIWDRIRRLVARLLGRRPPS